MRFQRWVVVLGLAASLVACVAPASPVPSSAPESAAASASSPGLAGLPLSCAPIDLRSPDGERVDLGGAWAGTGNLVGDGETAWLTQIGDCVYGSVSGGLFIGEPEPGPTIANLDGRIGSDFRIAAEVIIVLQPAIWAFARYSQADLLIEWDEAGRIRLREDREPGEVAARCIQPNLACPDPIMWYRLEDGPLP